MKPRARSRSLAMLSVAGFVGGAWACGATAVEIPGTEIEPDGQVPPAGDSGFPSDGGFPFDGDFFDSEFPFDGEFDGGDAFDGDFFDGEFDGDFFDGEFDDGRAFDGDFFDGEFDGGGPPPDAGPRWDGGVPVTFASGEQPVALALDDGNVYWQNDNGTVVDCPLAGCAGNVPTLLAFNGSGSSGLELESIAAGESTAFFLTSSSAIDACPSGGCRLAPTTYWGSTSDFDAGFDGGDGLSAVLSDASNLYFADSLSVFSCPIGSSCSSPRTLVSTESGNLGVLAITASEVFYVVGADDFTQRIRAVPIAGGAPRVVCKSSSGVLSDIHSMVVAGGYVYFTAFGDSSIFECPAGGGTLTTFAQNESPYALATDGASVYWTAQGGSVGTCPVGAQCFASRTIASGQDNPRAIAVNSTTVYWTTATSIFSAVK